jgi:hypothetical protein
MQHTYIEIQKAILSQRALLPPPPPISFNLLLHVFFLIAFRPQKEINSIKSVAVKVKIGAITGESCYLTCHKGLRRERKKD